MQPDADTRHLSGPEFNRQMAGLNQEETQIEQNRRMSKRRKSIVFLQDGLKIAQGKTFILHYGPFDFCSPQALSPEHRTHATSRVRRRCPPHPRGSKAVAVSLVQL